MNSCFTGITAIARIPAKAGIQLALNHFLSLRENWIPAFAGIDKLPVMLRSGSDETSVFSFSEILRRKSRLRMDKCWIPAFAGMTTIIVIPMTNARSCAWCGVWLANNTECAFDAPPHQS